MPLFRHDPTFLRQELIQFLVVTLSVILIVSPHWNVYSISLWLKRIRSDVAKSCLWHHDFAKCCSELWNNLQKACTLSVSTYDNIAGYITTELLNGHSWQVSKFQLPFHNITAPVRTQSAWIYELWCLAHSCAISCVSKWYKSEIVNPQVTQLRLHRTFEMYQ